MNTIRIEPLSSADIDQVVALLETLLPFPFSPDAVKDTYAQLLQDSAYRIFVAKRRTEVLGTVTAICCQALANRFLVLEDVVVKPGHTGHGIGGKLMDAADVFAREHQCTYAILVSSGFRTNAHRFYEKQGFVEDVRGFRKIY